MKNRLVGETPLLILAVSMMAGIVVGDSIAAGVPLLPVFAGMVLVSLLLWKYEILQSVAIVLCFFVLGWMLTSRQKEQLNIVWPEGDVAYEAVVLSNPVEKPKTMAVDILVTANGHKLKCYLYKDDRSRALKIGDGLKIQSRISPNSNRHIGNFDYGRYLEVHGFSGTTFVPGWKWQKARVSLSGISRIDRARIFFLKLRSRLLARIRDYSSSSDYSDAYSVIAAMTLGDKTALSKDIKDIYSVTGASHVLALSGLHLGIIYSLLSLFVFRHRWQMFSQVLLVLSIWAFVFLVGMSTSVVRSAVMLTVYALLSLGRRDKMSVNTLFFTAIVMLIASPMSLFDVGFQMSYMAVLAILLFMPLMDDIVPGKYLMDHSLIRWGWGIVCISIAAQIGVAPLIAYYFGRLSVYFLLTNFIIVPAATLILYLSLVVLAMPSLAYILLYIVSSLNKVLEWVAAIPGASIDGLHPTKIQTTMIYVVIVAVYLIIVRLRRPLHVA